MFRGLKRKLEEINRQQQQQQQQSLQGSQASQISGTSIDGNNNDLLPQSMLLKDVGGQSLRELTMNMPIFSKNTGSASTSSSLSLFKMINTNLDSPTDGTKENQATPSVIPQIKIGQQTSKTSDTSIRELSSLRKSNTGTTLIDQLFIQEDSHQQQQQQHADSKNNLRRVETVNEIEQEIIDLPISTMQTQRNEQSSSSTTTTSMIETLNPISGSGLSKNSLFRRQIDMNDKITNVDDELILISTNDSTSSFNIEQDIIMNEFNSNSIDNLQNLSQSNNMRSNSNNNNPNIASRIVQQQNSQLQQQKQQQIELATSNNREGESVSLKPGKESLVNDTDDISINNNRTLTKVTDDANYNIGVEDMDNDDDDEYYYGEDSDMEYGDGIRGGIPIVLELLDFPGPAGQLPVLNDIQRAEFLRTGRVDLALRATKTQDVSLSKQNQQQKQHKHRDINSRQIRNDTNRKELQHNDSRLGSNNDNNDELIQTSSQQQQGIQSRHVNNSHTQRDNNACDTSGSEVDGSTQNTIQGTTTTTVVSVNEDVLLAESVARRRLLPPPGSPWEYLIEELGVPYERLCTLDRYSRRLANINLIARGKYRTMANVPIEQRRPEKTSRNGDMDEMEDMDDYGDENGQIITEDWRFPCTNALKLLEELSNECVVVGVRDVAGSSVVHGSRDGDDDSGGGGDTDFVGLVLHDLTGAELAAVVEARVLRGAVAVAGTAGGVLLAIRGASVASPCAGHAVSVVRSRDVIAVVAGSAGKYAVHSVIAVTSSTSSSTDGNGGGSDAAGAAAALVQALA